MSDNVISRNRDVEQLVRESCRRSDGGKDFLFVATADAHGAVKQMSHVIDYVNGMDVVDAGVFLGDMTDYVFFSQMDCEWYTKLLERCAKPFLTVIGNHDSGNDNDPEHSYRYVSDMYDCCIRPNMGAVGFAGADIPGDCYYYRDFSDHRLRFIVLNQFDQPEDAGDDGHYMYARNGELYSQKQIDFLTDTLLDTPEDYGVIILLHNSPCWMKADNITFSSTYFREGEYDNFGLFTYLDGPIIADIVNAWIHGQKICRTYRISPACDSISQLMVDVDYSQRGKGEFVAYLGGHYHNSIVSHSIKYPDQVMYSVDCLGTDPHTLQYSDTPRAEGTRDEDCFVAVAVDRENRLLKVTRIGARVADNGEDRLYHEIKW